MDLILIFEGYAYYHMHHIPMCTDFMFPSVLYSLCYVYWLSNGFIFIWRICKFWSH